MEYNAKAFITLDNISLTYLFYKIITELDYKTTQDKIDDNHNIIAICNGWVNTFNSKSKDGTFTDEEYKNIIFKGEYIDCDLYMKDVSDGIFLFRQLAKMRKDSDNGALFVSRGWKDGNGNEIDKYVRCLHDTLEEHGIIECNSPNSYNRKNAENPFGWEKLTPEEFVDIW